MIHTYLGETIYFEIKYKNRSSFQIFIDSYGKVEIHAPKKTPDEKVLELLEHNWGPILEKIKEMKASLEGQQKKVYENDETFLYLGKSYPIVITHNQNIEKDIVIFEGEKLQLTVKQMDDGKIKQALQHFYHQQCKSLVEASISNYQSYFKSKPRSIRISDSKTTWGTCDSNKKLTFNWKLAMAPIEVIDYVVVHEMCHMVHLNHDRSFWRLVGSIMPNYKEKEQWLARSNWKMTV